MKHNWSRGRFTGAMTCERCGLLPLDDEDVATECVPIPGVVTLRQRLEGTADDS